ncbi:MAG: tRNA (guanine(10)-N(2))-dimethyltransferase [Deltaproteobacteria bacterium]|nr:MAG: tRNA (guanine(10)-N(2))-dimethyltransferase [Deltaproteobacteria bacterium]
MLIREGKLKFLIERGVFYNPRMKYNRDLTCLVVKVLGEKIKFLDLLAASGVKGLRIAKEVGIEVCLNDINKKAYELIKKNAKINNLNVEVENLDANFLLNVKKGKFNFIDIDPFGTPVPFLDNAIMHLKEGYLGVTATDTATLCGVYPTVCYRRYGAIPIKTEFCHEIGLRILIGYIARTAAKYNKGIKCLLSYSMEHYFRAFVEIVKGKKKAEESLKELGYLYYCKSCMNRKWEKTPFMHDRKCECGDKFLVSGPVWLGNIKSDELCKKIFKIENEKTIKRILEEPHVPFYFDIPKICKKLKSPVPKFDKIIAELKKRGYKASRTHFSLKGIKTDASIEELRLVLHAILT